MNARTFTLELEKWFKDEVEDRIVLITRMIGLEVLKRVILKTPVDTGRARGNWFVAIGAPDTRVTDNTDKTGAATINSGQAVITGLTQAQAVYITNNLPYIGRLENGHSQQAPAGMVAVTMAELEAFFSKVK